jgi:Tfp pilus assembly protein PilF
MPVHFEIGGWTRNRRATDAAEWTDALGNTLRLEILSVAAPYLLAATDRSALREWCRRNAARRDGGIVSVDLVDVCGRQGLQIINKFERLPSYDYEGTLVLPLRGAHCRFVVRAREHGTTGMREAIITNHLLSFGELDLRSLVAGPKNSVPIPGWFKDPYDPAYKGRTLRSLADDPRVDGLFPDHPLTRVRTTLVKLRATMELDDVDKTDSGPTLPFTSSREEGRTSHEMSGGALGALLLQMGRVADAQSILAESLKDHVANVNADPTRVAAEWQILGFAHEAQGQLEAAEAAFREAAMRFAASLGERHLRTAQAVNNRARILIARKDAAAAESLFRSALEVFESEGSETTDAAVALNGLGLVYIANEQYAEAVGYFERAVGIFERVHGPAFPDTATALRNMALAWKRLGDLERMVETWQRAEGVEKASKAAGRR